MIIDTDILVWYFRGNQLAAMLLAETDSISFSAVTYMELLQGMRNKEELGRFRHEMSVRNWKVISLDEQITSRAMTYIEEYALSHSMAMADALIAATCVEYGLKLIAANDKHYNFLAELELELFRP